MNNFGMQPGIILLREGTDSSQGKPQLISNINACYAISDAIRTTLGPCGRDKLVYDGRNVTISNDGATVMRLLEVEHPAAKTLVDISISQDIEVGDGTTSVVLLASEILNNVKPYVEENIHPQIIMKYIQLCGSLVTKLLQEDKKSCIIPYPINDPAELNNMLLKCASTALNSKLIASHQDLFAPMVVDAVQSLLLPTPSSFDNTQQMPETLSLNHESDISILDDIKSLIAIKRIPGGDVRQSFLVQNGVAFQKTFSYAGFEQMKKKFENPKVLLLNVELELKSEKENAEVRITEDTDKKVGEDGKSSAATDIMKTYQSIVDAEWEVIYHKLDACIDAGANIVLSKLPIGDLATQYFADRGLFCAGRVTEADLARVAYATGAKVQTSCNDLFPQILGTCALFEERQVGDERFNIFEQCPSSLTSTIVLRGGTEQFIAESERSINDALMVVKRCLKSIHFAKMNRGNKENLITTGIVAGGGAIEMEISKYLYNYSLSILGKGQLIVNAFAKALEVIPRQLSANAGFDPTDVLSALRKKHMNDGENDESSIYFGVDIVNGTICNTFEKGVWEPSDNKLNSIQAATEAACVILSIDETVIAPRSQDAAAQQASGMMGGGQKPMSNMMGNAMNAASSGGLPGQKGQLGPGVSYMKGHG